MEPIFKYKKSQKIQTDKWIKYIKIWINHLNIIIQIFFLSKFNKKVSIIKRFNRTIKEKNVFLLIIIIFG